MSVSTALPCRISIYEEGGKTILATLKPTTLLALFNTPELKTLAQEVEDTIVKIMQKAQGALIYANSRHIFSAELQDGWQRVDDVEWEVVRAGTKLPADQGFFPDRSMAFPVRLGRRSALAVRNP